MGYLNTILQFLPKIAFLCTRVFKHDRSNMNCHFTHIEGLEFVLFIIHKRVSFNFTDPSLEGGNPA